MTDLSCQPSWSSLSFKANLIISSMLPLKFASFLQSFQSHVTVCISPLRISLDWDTTQSCLDCTCHFYLLSQSAITGSLHSCPWLGVGGNPHTFCSVQPLAQPVLVRSLIEALVHSHNPRCHQHHMQAPRTLSRSYMTKASIRNRYATEGQIFLERR